VTSPRPSRPFGANARRVVVDSNVWVSGLIDPSGPPGRVLDAVRTGRIEAIASWDLADEITAVLSRPKLAERYRITADDIADVLALLAPLLPTVDVTVNVDVRDHKDVPVLAAAVAGGAELIVTGDLDLFDKPVRVWLGARGTDVISPAALLDLLDASDP
jgi:putative PIN family toxin of toxin-antitoxin system